MYIFVLLMKCLLLKEHNPIFIMPSSFHSQIHIEDHNWLLPGRLFLQNSTIICPLSNTYTSLSFLDEWSYPAITVLLWKLYSIYYVEPYKYKYIPKIILLFISLYKSILLVVWHGWVGWVVFFLTSLSL
jgi:hypothetical protein